MVKREWIWGFLGLSVREASVEAIGKFDQYAILWKGLAKTCKLLIVRRECGVACRTAYLFPDVLQRPEVQGHVKEDAILWHSIILGPQLDLQRV